MKLISTESNCHQQQNRLVSSVCGEQQQEQEQEQNHKEQHKFDLIEGPTTGSQVNNNNNNTTTRMTFSTTNTDLNSIQQRRQQQQQDANNSNSNSNATINHPEPIVMLNSIDDSKLLSPVHRMFDGQSIFITGASGFIGRVLLEKLLRTYKGIKRVYILMRTKKNQLPYDRLHKQLLKVPIFDHIRSLKNGQEILDKIIVIPGDIAEPNLGISDKDLQMMLSDKSLSIVFHSAATIKFDEPLKTSIRLNLVATKTIIDFCKQLENLIGLCHVSTAYVNSDIKDKTNIDEKLYPMKDDPMQLIKLADILDENLMQSLKVKLVDERPNTYTYTKALSEQLINQEASELPVSIVRPSIVVAAWKEPLVGWIDNLNGPTGLILAIGKGLLRTMYCNKENVADIIPVDIVVNTMISSVYYTAKINNKLPYQTPQSLQNSIQSPMLTMDKNQKLSNQSSLASSLNNHEQQLINNGITKTHEIELEEEEAVRNSTTKTTLANGISNANSISSKANCISKHKLESQEDEETTKRISNEQTTTKLTHPIIHCTSGDVNPMKWADMENIFFPIARKYPSCQVLRYPYGTFKSNKYHDYITRIFVHFLPAIILDIISGALGKKRQLFSIYQKVHQAVAALTHFCCVEYNFKTKHIKYLELALEDPQDKKELFMDVKNVDWTSFWDSYILGAR